MKLNIGKGTIQLYLWRTIKLLASLVNKYICWPAANMRKTDAQPREVFANCVGFLDGSEIILRYRPLNDPEAYFSRKKIYGFNLQAICNHQGQFIYPHAGHIANIYDLTTFKAAPFY